MFGWIRRIVSYVRGRIAWIRTPEALKQSVVAHEAGHTLASWHLEAVESVVDVNVLPKNEFRGVTQIRFRNGNLLTVDQALESMVVCMSGMAAEDLLNGWVGEGGQNDVLHVIGQWLMISQHLDESEALEDAQRILADLYATDDLTRMAAEAYIGPTLAGFYAMALALLKPRLETLRLLAAELRRKKRLRPRHLRRLLGPRSFVSLQELFSALEQPS